VQNRPSALLALASSLFNTFNALEISAGRPSQKKAQDVLGATSARWVHSTHTAVVRQESDNLVVWGAAKGQYSNRP
jgi:hypothetical protein